MIWALSLPDISPAFYFSFSVKIILETTHKEHAHYPDEGKRSSIFSLLVVKLFWAVISGKLPVICVQFTQQKLENVISCEFRWLHFTPWKVKKTLIFPQKILVK